MGKKSKAYFKCPFLEAKQLQSSSPSHWTCVSRRLTSLTTRSMFIIGLKYKAQ